MAKPLRQINQQGQQHRRAQNGHQQTNHISDRAQIQHGSQRCRARVRLSSGQALLSVDAGICGGFEGARVFLREPAVVFVAGDAAGFGSALASGAVLGAAALPAASVRAFVVVDAGAVPADSALGAVAVLAGAGCAGAGAAAAGIAPGMGWT